VFVLPACIANILRVVAYFGVTPRAVIESGLFVGTVCLLALYAHHCQQRFYEATADHPANRRV